MSRYLALLRGINVGGKNVVPMAELRAFLSGRGFSDVQTYIQSGNVIWEERDTSVDAARERIQSAMQELTGVAIPVMIRTQPEMDRVVAELHAENREIPPLPAHDDPQLEHDHSPSGDAGGLRAPWIPQPIGFC